MKRFGLTIAIGLVLLPWPVLAENFQAKSWTPAELIGGVVKVWVNREEESRKTGSGFFVDPTGCFLTAAHVVINGDKPEEKLEVAWAKDIKKKPEILGKGEVVFFDYEIDMAVVCLTTSDFFPTFELASPAEASAISFGDKVKLVGYPLAGSDSVTLAPSTIIGFWIEPDLKLIGGADRVKGSRLNLIKTDGISGKGGSGSPVLNVDNKVIALMFAGQTTSAVPGLSITTESFRNWREKFEAAQIKASGCVFDPGFGYFNRDGKQYYDSSCGHEQDKNLENVVVANYQAKCSGALEDWVLKRVSLHIKRGSSVDKWFQYLGKVCPVGPAKAQADVAIAEKSAAAPVATAAKSSTAKSPASAKKTATASKPATKVRPKPSAVAAKKIAAPKPGLTKPQKNSNLIIH